jgi:hypothetical protein
MISFRNRENSPCQASVWMRLRLVGQYQRAYVFFPRVGAFFLWTSSQLKTSGPTSSISQSWASFRSGIGTTLTMARNPELQLSKPSDGRSRDSDMVGRSYPGCGLVGSASQRISSTSGKKALTSPDFNGNLQPLGTGGCLVTMASYKNP